MHKQVAAKIARERRTTFNRLPFIDTLLSGVDTARATACRAPPGL
jgi:hypothetical protein